MVIMTYFGKIAVIFAIECEIVCIKDKFKGGSEAVPTGHWVCLEVRLINY